MSTLSQDLGYALRTLSRRPGFTAVVVLTLALGIGANTALFSIVDGVLLEPLAYPDPDRVVMVSETQRDPTPGNFSYADVVDLRERSRSFDALAAWGAGSATLTGAGAAARIDGARVTADFFRVFGVEAAVGRTFLPDETAAGRADVVVLSDGLWRDRFGADPAVVGREVTLDGERHTVVGVMPPGYGAPYDARLWRPFMPTADPTLRRAFHNVRVVGRLADDADHTAAQTEADAIMAALAEAHPDAHPGAGARVQPLRDVIVDDARPMLLLLLGAVGLLLLIACANVANLFMARTISRRSELAIRGALGAHRGRLVQHLLAESVLLAAAAGAAGVLLAVWGTDALLALGGDMIPRASLVGVDGRMLAFAAAVSLATGVLFGLVPALRHSRPGAADAVLRAGRGDSAAAESRRLRAGFVVAQLALAVMLVCGAGLLIRSLARLQQVDPGFRAERLIGFELALPEARYASSGDAATFYDALLRRLEALPGVRSAGAALTPPVAGGGWSTSMRIEDRPRPESELPSVAFNVVSPGYFRTIGTPVRRGREFDARDDAGAPGVALVNRAAAERFWPGEDPVGRRISSGPNPDAPYVTIAGVVGNVREGPLERAPGPTLYFPLAQETFRSLSVVARTDADPAAVLPSVRDVVAALDPELPVVGLGTADEQLSLAVAEPRFNALMLGGLATLALLLACIGVYGVLAYTVRRRSREIGVRVALGAKPTDVVAMVVGDGARLAALGIVLGLAGAFALSRVLSSLLFEVPATDPATFAVVAGVVTVTALAATWLPARRAAGVDPMVALREE